jgi:hypothetical protein
MSGMSIDIKSEDRLEVKLSKSEEAGPPTSVCLNVYTKRPMKGKHEPLFLCADQADQLALELVRLASQLRAAEEQEQEETPVEVAA